MKLKYIYTMLFTIAACAGTNDKKFTSPPGYQLANPQTFTMPNVLNEISGIAFSKGNSSVAYTVQDEEGSLFYFTPGSEQINQMRFAGKGDYEDVAICNGQVIILKSDGILLSFALSETANKETANVKEWANLLPAAEYEGIYADENTGMLYVLRKQNNIAKHDKSTIIYSFALASDGNITAKENVEVSVKDLEKITGENKSGFRPSALAKQPGSNDWFIVSSANKLLVVTDDQWKIKNMYTLDLAMFNQPEGIAFDSNGDLYISNEGDKTSSGNILKFKFAKP